MHHVIFAETNAYQQFRQASATLPRPRAARFGALTAFTLAVLASTVPAYAQTGIADAAAQQLAISAANAAVALAAADSAQAAAGANGTTATLGAATGTPGAATIIGADGAIEAIARVTVSTRRRNETSQSVPTTMTVLDSKALDSSRIYRVQDLQQLLPSTTVNYVHARQVSFAVRGLGNNTASDGLEGSVGLYLDNVYLARPGMAAFDALDIQQLELLRGPQGTLFGKNTTAGVLNITTRQPTFQPERSVQLSAGSAGYVQGKASVSGALSDSVAGRVSAYKTHEDGYITNNYNGKKVQGGDRQGVRAQLLIDPDQGFNARIIADYNEEDSNNGTMLFYNAGPSGRFLTQAALVGGHPVTDPNARQVNQDSGSHVTVHQGGLSAEANWKLDNDYKLTSVSAYRFWNFTPRNDDGLEVPVTLNVGALTRHKQFTQEVRVATPLGRPVESVLGTYYYYQDLNNTAFTYNGPLADRFNATPIGAWNNLTSLADGHLRVNSYALFGQSIWHIDPKWDLTAGLRATHEDKTAQEVRYAPTGGAAVSGPALAARNARYGAYNSGDIRLHNLSPSALVTLAYKVDEDVLAFGTLSHGEKSGGINLAVPGAAGVSSLKVGNERANNLEFGLKSSLLDRRVQFNTSVFWTEVHGYQNNAYDPVSSTSYLTNAGNVRSRGVETELTARITRGLTLGGSASFNDVKYREYKNAPCPPERSGTSCDLSGRAALVNAPRWIANLNAQYTHKVADNADAYYNANYAFRASTYGTLDASEYSRIPAYSVSNASAGVRFKAGGTKWDVSLWAKNLFDKQYYTSMWNTSLGAYNAVIGTPRTVGLTAKADF
ncbi:TonB-dependent receptor [Oxalobacteraceae bacterium]|nr:TonB-dependent receptor [Oxalobacteraceae bacterium]